MRNETLKLPENVLGYSYNGGGFNNQKLALFGLFLKAFREGPRRLVLPNFLSFDQVSGNHLPVPLKEALQYTPLHDFATRHGIEIVDISPRGDEGGWDYFHLGRDYIPCAALLNDLAPGSFSCDLFRSLVPNVQGSNLLRRLADMTFGQRGIRAVAQMRIENDWAYHSVHRLGQTIKRDTEDNAPSFLDIISKIRNTLSDVPSSIYVVSDEAALPVPKDQIRRAVKQQFNIDLFWKSDFLSKGELSELSLLTLSIIDFEIAIAANSFIGLTRSTFSNMVTFEKYARTRLPVQCHYIYNTIGPRLALRMDNGAFPFPQLAAAADPWNAAFDFQLAEIFQAAGERKRALEHYAAIAASSTAVPDEIFISLYRAAQLKEQLDHPYQEVIESYLKATEALPTRAEALHGASRFCRAKAKNAEGMVFARRGLAIPLPPDGLFIEPWVYEYGLLDELAINAYWAGAYRESLDACLKLLACDELPPSMLKRVAANARFAADKLPASKPHDLGTFGTESLVQQHKLVPQRSLHSCIEDFPRVLVAILAKQKEQALPLYLDRIEALDYPKSSMILYIRTNNNTDRTEQILRDWITQVGHLYHAVEFDASNVAESVEEYSEHEWNAKRFGVLGHIRNRSMRRALDLECDFYFVVDVDNFIRSATLRELVALDLPIAAPLLRSIVPERFYSNYHAETDANGYYKNCDQYYWILSRYVRGLIEVPVVHCTYLVRADVIPHLTYEDASGRHEYVVFSESARKAAVPQYLDNRQVYGYITFGKDSDHHVSGGIQLARALLSPDQPLRSASVSKAVNRDSPRRGPDPRTDRNVAYNARPKTLIFCTSFAKAADEWNDRYRRWLEAIGSSQLEYHNILIVDDGSPVLPDWIDTAIGTGEIDHTPEARTLLYHFQEHLGRDAVFDFPGWHRSFTFAGRYAHARGFDKVIHIESDAFLIGSRIQSYFNDAMSGWTALWCPRHGFPESSTQIIAGDSIKLFAELYRTHPHEQLIGREFEFQLPFDFVEKRFIGDRYGEYLPFVPGNAEYAVQVRDGQNDDYYWWLRANPRS